MDPIAGSDEALEIASIARPAHAAQSAGLCAWCALVPAASTCGRASPDCHSTKGANASIS